MAVWSCSDGDDNEAQLLKVDGDLSLQGAIGGDMGLAVGFDGCSTITGPATALAGGTVLATLDTPRPWFSGLVGAF